MKKNYSSKLVKDLLTQNSFWTFWASDYSQRINIHWAGSISFEDIKDTMRMKLGEGFMYERQVQLMDPDIKFL